MPSGTAHYPSNTNGYVAPQTMQAIFLIVATKALCAVQPLAALERATFCPTF